MNKYESAENDLNEEYSRYNNAGLYDFTAKAADSFLDKHEDTIRSALKIAAGMEWRPIEEAPENTPVLVRWPMVLVDEDGNLTDEVTVTHTVIAQKTGDYWDDMGSMEITSADWRGDDDETAEAPLCWLPLPPAPEEK